MKKILLVLITSCLGLGATAQIDAPVKWSYAAKRLSSTEAVVFLKATINDGWHIYGMDVKDGGPIKTSFTFSPSKTYSLVGKTLQPTPVSKYEKAFSMNVTYFEKAVVFQQKIHLKSPGAQVVKGQLEYMSCNDKKCLPPEDVDFSVPIAK